MDTHSVPPLHSPYLLVPIPSTLLDPRQSPSDWNDFLSFAPGQQEANLLVHDPRVAKEDWGHLLGDYAFGRGLDKLEHGSSAPFLETPSPDAYSPSSVPHSAYPTPSSNHAPLSSPNGSTLADFATATALAGFSSVMPPHLRSRRGAPMPAVESGSEGGTEVSAGVAAGLALRMVVAREEPGEGKGKKPRKARKAPSPVAGEVRTAPKKSGTKPEGYTPRPPNAWILYRSEQIRILKSDKETSGKPQSDISKLIGYMWRDEAPEVRSWYDALAEEKKLEHAIKHPDYRFCPVRKHKPRPPKFPKQSITARLPSPARASPSRPYPPLSRIPVPISSSRRRRAHTTSHLETLSRQPILDANAHLRDAAPPPEFTFDPALASRPLQPAYPIEQYPHASSSLHYYDTHQIPSPPLTSEYAYPVPSEFYSLPPFDTSTWSHPSPAPHTTPLHSHETLPPHPSPHLDFFSPLPPLSAAAAAAQFSFAPPSRNLYAYPSVSEYATPPDSLFGFSPETSYEPASPQWSAGLVPYVEGGEAYVEVPYETDLEVPYKADLEVPYEGDLEEGEGEYEEKESYEIPMEVEVPGYEFPARR